MSQPIPQDVAKQIADQVLAGNKIAAIKLHRDVTGEGLKESKDAVEALEAELRSKNPQAFAARAAGRGCLSAIVLCALGTLAVLLTASALRAEEPATVPVKARERIGVYDSRAIAVAYAGSAAHEKTMSALMAEHAKAKAAGDTKRLDELENEGAARQRTMHKQGFSMAPVDNILEQIKDKLPAIAETSGVTVLVSKWDKDTLAKHPSAEQVDVTMALVDAFNPGPRQRKGASEIQKHAPISLEQAENLSD